MAVGMASLIDCTSCGKMHHVAHDCRPVEVCGVWITALGRACRENVRVGDTCWFLHGEDV